MSAGARVWWKRKRVLLPMVLTLLIAIALGIAVIRSDTSQIMLYNDTGATLGPVTVRACGQEFVVPSLADETSVRFRLAKVGAAGEVELLLAGEPPWQWKGEYVENHGGYLVFIHLRRDREVEAHTQISFWQRMLFGRVPGS
jgi:hypothetical protein